MKPPTPPRPDPTALAALPWRICAVFTRGDGPTRKALLKTLIAEIKVEHHATVRPSFYVPAVASNNEPHLMTAGGLPHGLPQRRARHRAGRVG
jgi:hypothetical protein